MLYEEDIRKVNIIDFEYQSPNPAAFDIAEHFNEYAGLEVRCVTGNSVYKMK